MYVIYWQSERSPFRFFTKASKVPGKYWFPFEKSESQWMVPGTVDPNE